jgi:hypothetical protein
LPATVPEGRISATPKASRDLIADLVMRPHLILVSLAAATSLHAQRPRPMVSFPGLTVPVMLDTAGYTARIAGAPASIYAQLRAEYDRMKVQLTTDDSLTGIIGNLQMLRIRTLAGGQISRFLNCGGGMTGPLADNARVQLALVSMLKSVSADSTEVRTVLVGVATSLEGASRDPVRCTSAGTLEARIHERISKQLTKP